MSVIAEVVDVKESKAIFETTIQQGIAGVTYDVKLEVLKPDELRGKSVTVETMVNVGNAGGITSPGTLLKFYIDPRLLDSDEKRSLKDLISWTFVNEDDL